MKKLISLALIIVLFISIAACNRNGNGETTTLPEHITDTVSGTENFFVSEDNRNEDASPVTTQTEQKLDQGGADILPGKYRNNYYQIPVFFAEIVDRNVFDAWEKEYYLNNYPDNTNVMVMVDFIKEFNISKENFEKANLKYAKFIDELYSHICLDPQDYADQEMQEIYNADIIYTFDNELINEYYLGIDYPFLNEYQYVEALEAGTYKTRTTQFITVDQMEAEIIAKYGEAEIVTEAETTAETESSEAPEITGLPEETAQSPSETQNNITA
ncbi:MAG: hypothetical protein IKW12_04995 [Clostridia bacterium]|nr:hypothetical protein [Clostridia bacterium]